MYLSQPIILLKNRYVLVLPGITDTGYLIQNALGDNS